MTKRSLHAIAGALALAVSIHALLSAQNLQGVVGRNVSVVGGIKDQFIGDMFRQRQNEVVSCTFAVNPSQQVFAYNDYRTVDAADDAQIGTPSAIQRSLFAKLLTPFRQPRAVVADADHASALAWIGLSFTDNGTNFYTGLHPASPYSPSVPGDDDLRQYHFTAASDPVFAATPSHCLLAVIAFSPGGLSAGFVSRFTSRNDSERTSNVVYDWSKVLYRSPAISGTAASDFFVDKPYIACGATGRCVVAFVVFDQSDPSKLSSKVITFTSRDYGETWSTTPVVVSQPVTRNQSPWILIDPNNDNVVYIGWRVFANPKYPTLTNAIVGKRSSNGGASFDPIIPYPVALLLRAYDAPQTVYPLQPITPRSNAYPTAVLDAQGTLSVFIQEYVDANGYPLSPLVPLTNGKARITQTSSYNGGLTWTLRRAFDFGPDSGPQFMPSAAVTGVPGPACPGKPGPRSRIAVMYYDARPSYPGGAVFTGGGGARFDVRVAQADPCLTDAARRPVFGPSQAVSRYSVDGTPQHKIVTSPGFGYPAVNAAYRMFNATQSFFTGDYIHVTPKVGYVLSGGAWKATTAASVSPADVPSPVWKGTWADTRDVTLPKDPAVSGIPFSAGFIDGLPWEQYAPPHSGLPVPACANPGSRDQNPYMAEISDGLYAAAPVTFRDSTGPRAYPLYVENRTGLKRFFRLAISPDPAVLAGFNLPPVSGAYVPVKTSDVAIGSFSTVTGSVIAAANFTDSFRVTVSEITGIGGSPAVNGLAAIVTVNNGTPTGSSGTEARAPILDPAPIVTKPYGPIPAGGIVVGPNGPNPNVNPFTDNPFTDNAGATPFTDNPFTDNPFTDNTMVYDATDVTFVASSGGTNTASYSAVLNIAGFNATRPGDYKVIAFINRPSLVPSSRGCQTVEVHQPIQVSSLKNPFTDNPFTDNAGTTPFTDNPFTDNAAPGAKDENVSNSTFYLAPPSSEDVSFHDSRPQDRQWYTLRVFQLVANPAVTITPAAVTLQVAAHEPDVVLKDGELVFERTPDGQPLKHVSTAGAQVPAQLVFTTQPATNFAGPGSPLVPAVVVAVADVFGNTVTSYNQPVTVALASNPSGATLSGTATRNAVNGVASFPGLVIDKAGADYTLAASSGPLSAASIPFDVLALPPPSRQAVADTDVLSFGRSSMRGAGTGSIVVSGVTGTVTKALLYWHGPTNSTDDEANALVSFAGHTIRGVSEGYAYDNNWGFSNSQSYGADVTYLVAGNGTYALANFRKAGVSTVADVNGASLIVFFDDGNPLNNRDVYLFATNDSNSGFTCPAGKLCDPAEGWSDALTGIVYGSGAATLQLHVSDGQGFGDGGVTVNGTEIVPAGANFQGNSVPPNVGDPIGLGSGAGGLWDIKNYDITSLLSAGSNAVTLTSPIGAFSEWDWLSLVVMLFDVPHVGALHFGALNVAATTFTIGSPQAAPISGTVVNGTNADQANLSIQSIITQGSFSVGAAGAILRTQGNVDGMVPANSIATIDPVLHQANASQTSAPPFVPGPATLTIQLNQFIPPGAFPLVDARTFPITLVTTPAPRAGPLVTYTFTGVVDSVDPSLADQFDTSMTLTGTFTYDSSTQEVLSGSESNGYGDYRHAAGELRMQVGNYIATAPPFGTDIFDGVQVANNWFGADTFNVAGRLQGPVILGFTPIGFLELTDTTMTAIGDTQLAHVVDLTGWPGQPGHGTQWYLAFSTGGGAPAVRGHLTSITYLPPPPPAPAPPEPVRGDGRRR